MIRDWLIIGLVFSALWLFWLWLGFLFDAITAWHDASREVQGDAEARRSNRQETEQSALQR